MSILDQHLNPSLKGFTVYEGDQFIGRFTLGTAPNKFLAELMREAEEYGDAEGTDSEGCVVTVTADD